MADAVAPTEVAEIVIAVETFITRRDVAIMDQFCRFVVEIA
jgi:hypothetical protein